ncbi:MAG: hypothetical protein AAGD09_12465 [Cyanobacteria bacterium P01_F01_bin.56]
MYRPRFRFKKSKSASRKNSISSTSSSKLLLQILEPGQSPDDVRQRPRDLALKGQDDVYISRAEIDLRKAIQSMAFITHGQINSLPTLAALSLPSSAAALFWAIHALLKNQYPTPNLGNPIHHRNHDARLLFQQLARLDIDQWYIHSVNVVSLEALPMGTQFPAGHPVPGHIYRQHPCQEKHYCYYPVTSYFSLLFDERETALLELLKSLGAAKVIIADRNNSSSYRDASTQKVFEYTTQSRKMMTSIDVQKHPWLPYEAVWQTVVNQRLETGILSTQFELNLDIMELLKTQIQTIAQLMPEFSSMTIPTNLEERLSAELLQAKTVQVEFK